MPAPLYLSIPRNTSDQQLAKVLEKVLGDYFIRHENRRPDDARRIARNMAGEIVSYAAQCRDLAFVDGAARRIAIDPASLKECDAVQEWSKYVEIRYREGDPVHAGQARVWAGKAWNFVREDILHSPDRGDDPRENAAVGPRG